MDLASLYELVFKVPLAELEKSGFWKTSQKNIESTNILLVRWNIFLLICLLFASPAFNNCFGVKITSDGAGCFKQKGLEKMGTNSLFTNSNNENRRLKRMALNGRIISMTTAPLKSASF